MGPAFQQICPTELLRPRPDHIPEPILSDEEEERCTSIHQRSRADTLSDEACRPFQRRADQQTLLAADGHLRKDQPPYYRYRTILHQRNRQTDSPDLHPIRSVEQGENRLDRRKHPQIKL